MSPLSIEQMLIAREEKRKFGSKSMAVIPIEWVIYENYERKKAIPKYADMVKILVI